MASCSSSFANPQSIASDSFSSAKPQKMASDNSLSSSPQNVASNIISHSNELKPQESTVPDVELKTNLPKSTVVGRSMLKDMSADVRNLLITARDKSVSSLKSIGPSKHASEHVPIWKRKNKHSHRLTLRKLAKKLHVDDLLPPEAIPHPAETPVLTKPSMLEALPTELLFKILHFAPSLAALSCLVHASPKLHSAYAAIRREVLEKVTWIELFNRNVNLFSQRDFYEIHVSCSKDEWKTRQPRLKTLIAICRAYGKRTGRIELKDQVFYPRFSIDQCILLLAIQDYVGWTIRGRPGRRYGKSDRMDIGERRSYRVLNFSRETMESVGWIRANATLTEFWAKSE